jgi:hypothetical protein
MARWCFREKNSHPPICGVHNVPLMKKQSANDLASSGFGDFAFLVCPVSHEVVNDE